MTEPAARCVGDRQHRGFGPLATALFLMDVFNGCQASKYSTSLCAPLDPEFASVRGASLADGLCLLSRLWNGLGQERGCGYHCQRPNTKDVIE